MDKVNTSTKAQRRRDSFPTRSHPTMPMPLPIPALPPLLPPLPPLPKQKPRSLLLLLKAPVLNSARTLTILVAAVWISYRRGETIRKGPRLSPSCFHRAGPRKFLSGMLAGCPPKLGEELEIAGEEVAEEAEAEEVDDAAVRAEPVVAEDAIAEDLDATGNSEQENEDDELAANQLRNERLNRVEVPVDRRSGRSGRPIQRPGRFRE
mmetsp:Transcript_18884/g.31331  ORF Transcript_18884/g.31331 Transcript_18884/m.31331 type:complete len:207 (-) Transcript_18884:44-664(-)